MCIVRKFHNDIILYLSLLLLPSCSARGDSFVPTSAGVDFRMTSITWTFQDDKKMPTSHIEGIQNCGGLYFNADVDKSFIKLDNEQSHSFSDGQPWVTNQVACLSGNSFDEKLLEGNRRIAGLNSAELKHTLAFNTSVPGTCYVAVSSAPNKGQSSTVKLCFQHKGLEAKWVYSKEEKVVTDQITELKLTSESCGSYWISSDKDIYVYAVRFEPSETIPLIQTNQQPVKLQQLANGNWFADYGKAAFGQIEITLNSDRNTDTLLVHLGECIKDGSVDRNPGGSRRYECIKIPLEKGLHTYKPIIPYKLYSTGLSSIYMPMEIGEVMPFRYCEIENAPSSLNINDVTRIAVNSRFNEGASDFHCDDEILNQVWDMCKYSMKATSFIGYYVDGDRERRPYEADALINQLGHYACDSEYTLAQRTIEWLIKNPTWPTEWMMQTVMMAWYDYLYSGDATLISKYTTQLRNHTLLDFVNPETGLVTTTAIDQTQEKLLKINSSEPIRDIVDWPHSDEDKEFAPQGGEDDGFVYTDYNAVVNAYHYEACKLMSKIYAALNQEDSAKELEEYCVRFKDLYNKSFLNKDKGIYSDGIDTDHSSLHSNMFALCFGLVPDEYVNSVSNFVESRGVACSVYGAQFLLEALYKSGKSDVAMQYMSNQEQRSWMNMIKEGSTITMEAWSNAIKPNQDWNHAWGAAPANIILFHLMGIQPVAPGFKRAIICPQIGSLKEAECKVPTQWGGIIVKIRKGNEDFSMSVDIPENVSCHIYLPIRNDVNCSIIVDGEPNSDYTVVNNYVKLTDAVTGHHVYRVKNTSTDVQKPIKSYSKSSAKYDLQGRKVTNAHSAGVYISNGQKTITK